nr:DUF3344 domain-containing protein [uncultured Methanobrevibacter sp.]
MMVFSLSAVCADDLQTTDSGQVSGDVDVVTVNPWTTSGELAYDIPADAKDIKSADVYVNVYGGSAKNTHGANANVSLKTENGENQIASEELWIEYGTTDGTIYTVNNHTDKCYSDYQMHYDITDSIKGLNGSSIVLKVDTFKMDNKTFDGRIKLIALVLAYDDGDSDVINYWVDSTQKWTKTNITTAFATKDLAKIYAADLINVALSSADGSFKINDELIGDAKNHSAGNYYQYNCWDVTDKIKAGYDTEFVSMNVGTSSYSSLKNVLSVLKVNSQIMVDVSLATEYSNTCYAGTNNTITVTATSSKAGKYLIELLADGKVVNSSEIDLDGENITAILLTDPTVRAIDETTVSGANNANVVYAVNVKLNGIDVASANKTVPVLYNGNLGKDLAYNVGGFDEVIDIEFTGGIVVDTKSESSYKSGATGTTEVWTVNLDNNSSIVKGFVYVPYNWFNGKTYIENETMFNVNFNNVTLTPFAFYRDQSNLGSYGKYGYGVLVYDVSELILNGNNTFELSKINPTPTIYPSTLIYAYDDADSKFIYHAYIVNGADLLANSNNNAGRVAAANSKIDVISKDVTDAALYVFASGAQSGEGNIIVNGKLAENVWNGTSKTTDLYVANITDVLKDSNDISFVATGSTILALHQMIVTAQKAPVKTTVTAKALSTTYNSEKAFTITVLDSDKKPVTGLKLTLKVFTGKASKNYYATTNSKGVATFKAASALAIGTHKVEITSSNTAYDVKKTTSSIKVAKAKTTVKAPKVTAKVKKTKYFKVTVKNKASKKVVKGLKIKVKVYTGKKYKTYNLKTNKKGVAQLNIKSLKVGKHKVVISSGNAKYTVSAKSTITIKK